MSHLKGLKFTSAVPLRATNDPVERAREKVVAALFEQKAMVNAKLAGQDYFVVHNVWRKNEAGERVRVNAPKRLRQGWFTDETGKVFFALRYAGKSLEFAKDKNAIDVGELTALPAILDKLVDAVRDGELDVQLTTAAVERVKVLRKAD